VQVMAEIKPDLEVKEGEDANLRNLQDHLTHQKEFEIKYKQYTDLIDKSRRELMKSR
jgi:hypothetical protein